MRIGISTVLRHENPEDWARQMRELGAGAVVFPMDWQASEELVCGYVEAAKKYDLVIAEVGSWMCNPASPDEEERKAAIAYSVEQLRLADRIGAACCVNVTGSAGKVWDRAYVENFSTEHWRRTVDSIREIIDRAEPQHTFYTVEPMPWMVPGGPEEYERLMDEVGRDRFAVHMDLANWICTPDRYFYNREFVERCFTVLGKYVKSCHIKDVCLQQEFTFQLKEVACGEGSLDLEAYGRLAEQVSPDMPMLIEHLHSDEEYLESITYLSDRMRKAGFTLR